VSRGGQLLPEVRETIAVIARHHLVLATGHSSPVECLMLVREGRRVGVDHIVITHAMKPPIRMNIAQMKQAAAEGAYLEFDYEALIGTKKLLEIAQYAAAMRTVGVAHCIVSSDLGQSGNPLHPDGLIAFFKLLREQGFSVAEIEQMAKKNPAALLGLQ
jgi:predicted metal-dependent phosphotriesterase family hydrolase